MNIDIYDKQILELLQDNSKISNQELAEKINLSASACLRRVKVLEDNGFIDKYRCILNNKKLGLGLMVLVSISMDSHTPERFEIFQKAIVAVPEVIECLIITGQSADYQLKVLVRDLEHYHKVLLEKITRIKGVTGVHSSFVLDKVIENRAVPIYLV
ncbi:MAG: Lrp/AsnC family transcriptional regulator [Neisseriaceae bacterium]|jgi:Lrp/AsnC family leucine-responsive transcriptional regulator|nr:MAG: Lrp/AsnC family transcriptional regulator [Neisseriaceae bacterium]